MRRILVLVLLAALVVLAYGAWRWAGGDRGVAATPGEQAGVTAAAGVAGQDGPGLKAATAASLPLPVPRTPDLAHVDPAPFAAALGHDPTRIFEFVRDQVAYEPYAGCLRGPRGTLLALAGNAVDRASLLAGMLASARQRTRFAQGRLPDGRARELVASVFVERAGAAAPAPPASGMGKEAANAIAAGVSRDGRLLATSLKNAGLPPRAETATLDSLVEEARDHWWVQWWRDGAWVDLDPSFASAAPGTTYATAAATFDALPESLFHRVDLVVRVEEYQDGEPATRDILKYSATAADLSGADVVFAHVSLRSQPGGGSGLGAFGPATGATGQVKPLLIVKGRQVEGAPFWQRTPRAGGGLGFGGLLGGGEEPAPAAVPVAVAEFVQIDFAAPGRARETVVREIFDLAGPALRAKGETLKAPDVSARSNGSRAPRLTETFHDLFFSTGALHGAHLENLALPTAPAAGDPVDVAASLRLANVLLAATSDAAIGRIETPDRGVCRFYPDSPRVHIAELTVGANGMRLSMDLRRDRARAVGSGVRKEHLFAAQVLRGVVAGHLERALADHLGGTDGSSRAAGARLSTSLVFDLAQAAKVPTVLLQNGAAALAPNVPADGRARVEAALAGGHVALAPTRPVAVAGGQRFAWWQVDPRSGETMAVTDEGLHQATVEINVVESRQNGGTVVFHGIKGGRACAHPENFTNVRAAMRYTNELKVWLQDKGYKVIVNEYWTEFLL
jgi:hypothetical protein